VTLFYTKTNLVGPADHSVKRGLSREGSWDRRHPFLTTWGFGGALLAHHPPPARYGVKLQPKLGLVRFFNCQIRLLVRVSPPQKCYNKQQQTARASKKRSHPCQSSVQIISVLCRIRFGWGCSPTISGLGLWGVPSYNESIHPLQQRGVTHRHSQKFGQERLTRERLQKVNNYVMVPPSLSFV